MEVKRALISVSDKTGLEEFVKGLNELGVEILSTGGTAKLISRSGIPVRRVSDYTGFPEMLDGRVKTLHPKIHGALLALRDNPEHMNEVGVAGIELIDMVVVNLYPFEETVQKQGVSLAEAIEQIDIGGPSMLRSAAKNFKNVAVISNPARYPDILKELRENEGSISEQTSKGLAVEVFERTSHYDRIIHRFLKEGAGAAALKDASKGAAPFGQAYAPLKDERFAPVLELNYDKLQDLRYGENPHQEAAFYGEQGVSIHCVTTAKKLHGKELSFNNILDLDSALEIVRDFSEPAVSVIKHTNPCGAAQGETLAKAYKDALECDPLSAFGSIVGLNKTVDEAAAKEIAGADFVECVIGPGYSEAALEILKSKKNLRILRVPGFESGEAAAGLDFKKVLGGLLVQERDSRDISAKDFKIVTEAMPGEEMFEQLLFAWKIAKHTKSNSIVLAKGTKTVGIGAGQMSRVDSVILAIRKAGGKAKGSCLASDAFFPKKDAVEAAVQAGITAIIQPGGSIRDEEVIEACNAAGIPMVFAGMRHFRH